MSPISRATTSQEKPLQAVLMLRYLGLTPADYGLALGLPCLAAVLGSQLCPALTRTFGQRWVLLAAGLLRTPWLLLIPLAAHGMAGLTLIVLADTGLLFTAGVFGPSFYSYRMEATDDAFMARVLSSWSVSSKVVQPAFIAAGGVLTAVIGLRPAMAVGGLVCLGSALCLPWRHDAATAEPAEPGTGDSTAGPAAASGRQSGGSFPRARPRSS